MDEVKTEQMVGGGDNNQQFIHRIKMAVIICVGACMFIQDVESLKFK